MELLRKVQSKGCPHFPLHLPTLCTPILQERPRAATPRPISWAPAPSLTHSCCQQVPSQVWTISSLLFTDIKALWRLLGS